MTSSTHKLVVTKPCQEAWDSMTTADNGRYCKSCEKIVIDFSVLSDDEIKTFFLGNNHKPVCGRFYKSQLDRIKIYIPSYVFTKRIPVWKKFLIVFLICFGSNLYPFDVVIGNQNLYAQSSTNKSSRKKKKNKYFQIKLEFIPETYKIPCISTEEFVMGGMQTIRWPEVISVVSLPEINLSSSASDSESVAFEPLAGKEHAKRERSPGKSKSGGNTDYILPARLSYRRKKPRPG